MALHATCWRRRYKTYHCPSDDFVISSSTFVTAMPSQPTDQAAISTPLARTPSDRSKMTTSSNDEIPQKPEDDHHDASNGAALDIEKGVETDNDGGPAPDPFLVEFDGLNDPGNPKNWSQRRRWCITISMGLMVFTVTFASSIFSVNLGVIVDKFDVTIVTATLGVALFVLVCWTALFQLQRLTRSRGLFLVPSHLDQCQKC